MSDNEVFIIDDLSKFIESTRILVFNSFGKNDDDNEEINQDSFLISSLEQDQIDELNQILPQTECEIIAKDFIKQKKNKKNNKIRYIISSKTYMDMIESFNSRMISNILNNMVNKGIVESAYDSELNDFVFWIKDSGNQ